MSLTFDNRIQSNYNAGQWYRFMADVADWKHHEQLHGELGFATRELFKIQVADLVAYEAMKWLDNHIGPVKRPLRYSLMKLLTSHRFNFKYTSEQDLEKISRDLIKFDENSESLLKPSRFGPWLNQQGLIDNHSNRIRYLAYVHEHGRSTDAQPDGENS